MDPRTTTAMAALISVPIGILTSIYLVEYGRGALARGITFFVDVMTGIPSIVAGLFAYALFALLFGPQGSELWVSAWRAFRAISTRKQHKCLLFWIASFQVTPCARG